MTAAPKYVERIARLPSVLEHLAAYPEGMPLRELAIEFDVGPEQLREDLLAYYTADVGPELLMGLTRPGVLEFLGPDGEDEDPQAADFVRVVDPRNADELGVEYVDASELALIYTAALSLLEVQPDDEDVAAAVDALAATMFGDEPGPTPANAAQWLPALEAITKGQRARRRVDIVYSRAWHAGVAHRVIEPYRLVKSRRGWEVDAGPLDHDGTPRTFLLSNVREATLRDEQFEHPHGLSALLEDQRRTHKVTVSLPQTARWAAAMYAEHVDVVDDGELTVVLDLELLPPLRERLGLLLLAAGTSARVLEPESLRGCGAYVARTLLEHHRGSPSDG
ncbi:MAG TPA: WYL domain-containing protein [Nocardioidaceae bacterium]|nr:WYL domain-containing protein [Nocardioidaceae bacterium]